MWRVREDPWVLKDKEKEKAGSGERMGMMLRSAFLQKMTIGLMLAIMFGILISGCVIKNETTSPVQQQLPHNHTVPQSQHSRPELVLFTYEGFTSEYGLGRVILPRFEQQCNCTVRVIAQGDVGWLAAKTLSQDPRKPEADVVLGIDNSFKRQVMEKAKDFFEVYAPARADLIAPVAREEDPRLIPFDYGFIALMYNAELVSDYPQSLEEMTEKKYEKKIVMPDPRTSSTGRIFLFWVASEYGNETEAYLRRLKPNLLTVTPGWMEAYSLFVTGEAPYVVSYTTSPAYHLAFENKTQYRAITFPRMYKQVEYVMIFKNAKNPELARKFVDFLLSDEVQREIPLGNVMYPAINTTVLPDAFTVVEYPPAIAAETDDPLWLTVWERVFST